LHRLARHHRDVSRYRIDPDTSQVRIAGTSSLHPIHAIATGLQGWVELDGDRLSGEVRIEVGRLSSGNALIDRETRRRVDAARFPTITGKSTGATRLGPDRFAVTGDLTFRGEVRQVDGELTISQADGRLVVEGEQTFDVRDWGLKPPRIAMLKVHPEVVVRIHLVLDTNSGH
jgi:polyisoprenoid-binding protein YceI